MDNSSKVCFSSIYSSDNFEGTLCFCWSCAPTTPGDFLGSSLALKSTRKLRTESSLIPHHHPRPSHFCHLFDINRWRLPKRFRKPILFLRKKNNKKKTTLFTRPPAGHFDPKSPTDLPPSCQTQVLHGLNLVISPTKLHDPFIQTLLPDFFQCGSWSNVSKNTGVLFLFSERASGLRFLFPNKKIAIWWCTWWHWWNDECNYVDNNAVIWFMAQNVSKWLTNTEYDLCLWSLW